MPLHTCQKSSSQKETGAKIWRNVKSSSSLVEMKINVAIREISKIPLKINSRITICDLAIAY